ncbi:MAG: hypothetical protein ACFFC1_11560 [Promethearchaeota archaeon]
MRHKKLLVILILPFFFLLPFGKYANAQVPDYVGVAPGDTYTWKATVNFGNVDELLDNMRDLFVDWKAQLPMIDLYGLESMTIAEIYEQMANTYLDQLLPAGWESLNLTELIDEVVEDYVEQFNSTILSGMIPSNWQALNFSDFYDLIFDGLNATLPSSWEDNPIPELYKMIINELNSTIYFGLIPAGWESMTILDLYKSMIMNVAPVLGESFALHTMIDTIMGLIMPMDMLTGTMDDLFKDMASMWGPINATTLFEEIFWDLNQSMPGGMESELMSDVIDYMSNYTAYGLNMTLPFDIYGMNMSTFLELGIDVMVDEMLPVELQGQTIIDILDMGYTEAINMLTSTIIPSWDSMYLSLQTMGMTSYEVGLRLVINSIGSEVAAYPGGPMGAPINTDSLVSYDFEEWKDLETEIGTGASFSPMLLFSLLYVPTGAPTVAQYIVDPSTYSIAQTALVDQFLYSGTLIVADNYDWNAIQTEMTIVTTGNPDAIEMAIEWNNKGVLVKAEIKTDGLVVAAFNLISPEAEIPGYEIPIILGITGLSIIAIVLYGKRKSKIVK